MLAAGYPDTAKAMADLIPPIVNERKPAIVDCFAESRELANGRERHTFKVIWTENLAKEKLIHTHIRVYEKFRNQDRRTDAYIDHAPSELLSIAVEELIGKNPPAEPKIYIVSPVPGESLRPITREECDRTFFNEVPIKDDKLMIIIDFLGKF